MTQLDFAGLNQVLSPAAAQGMSDAWQRTLARLGSYTGLIIQSLNLRPTAAGIVQQTEKHLLVRLTIPQEHVILRIAPEADLAAYVYLLRAMAGHTIPAARLIHRDLTRTLVPFAYTLESYVPGQAADQLEDDALQRAAARQAGRLLRRIHRVSTPSAGRPNEVGRWPQQDWPKLLVQIGRRQRLEPTDRILFSDEQRQLLARISLHSLLEQVPVTLMHGDFGPQMVRCTSGGSIVHVEALVGSGDDIGGDPMFDLAQALRPSFGSAWCEGVLEGYLAGGQLSDDERHRLLLYQPLVNSWSACQRYQRGLAHEADLQQTVKQLSELADLYRFEAGTDTPAA